MAESMEIWFTPILLMPGAALLIMSTSARAAEVHGEFHVILDHHGDANTATLHRLLKRAALFRNALIGLYSAVSLFTSAALVGGLLAALGLRAEPVVFTVTCVGVLAVLFAAIELVRETTLSFDVIRSHVRAICRERDAGGGGDEGGGGGS